MLKAVFTDQIASLTLCGLTQWDKGRTVELECTSLPDNFQAHFATWEQPEALVISCTAINGKATIPIPNILLQDSADIAMWVYVTDGEKGETKKQILFPIVSRAKPADYVYTETEIFSYEKLEKKIEELENYVGQAIKAALELQNRKTTITLFADKWETIEEKRHIQAVNIPTVTNKSELRVDLTPEQVLVFSQKEITFIVGNDNGNVTIECIGQKPTNDYTVKVKIEEVNII